MTTNRKRKFTVEQQEEICQAYITGESTESIGHAWSVGQGTLYRILHEHNIPLRFNHHAPLVAPPLSLPVPSVAQSMSADTDTGKFRYRVGFYVRRTIHADSVESAVYKASGYDGFQELVYLRKES